jgi:peptidase E
MNFGRVAVVAVILSATACKSVQQIQDPATFIPKANPDVIVVTYTDNSQIAVEKPRVARDSLFGTWAGVDEPVAVPLSQVRRMDAVQRDKGRTTLAVAVGAGLMAAGVAAFTIVTSRDGKNCDYSYQPPTVQPGRCVGTNPEG